MEKKDSQNVPYGFAVPEMVGANREVRLLNGKVRGYIFLDNAASTPSFLSVRDKVNEALEWYSSVHRGYGFKSLLTSYLYDRAHELVGEFVGADHNKDVVIFTKNTTEAINVLANCTQWEAGDVVISTIMEHHSNDLPWRRKAIVKYVEIDSNGELDLNHYECLLRVNQGKIKFVAVTGASNVTGFTPPVHQMAALAHKYGTLISVDCAQLAPHREINMLPHDCEEHLDFVCISAHKMYAPYGSGALIGAKEYFNKFPPDHSGGGTIELVSKDEVYWAESPERNEAGSPNVIGAIALAESINTLRQVGMRTLQVHEQILTKYILEKMNCMSGIKIYGSHDPYHLDDRLGVISFTVENLPHAKTSAILGFEAGIGVRNGCFCAHPYILRLMGISPEKYSKLKDEVLDHDRRNIPGLIRVSFGCYNTIEDIDYFIIWLQRIIRGDYEGDYLQERLTGAYYPKDFVHSDLANMVKL